MMANMSKTLQRHLALVAMVGFAWLCLQTFAMACPTCAEGMNNDPNHATLVRGYFWSIIFMMSMPFVIFTALCSYFYYEIRRGRARQARGGEYAIGSASVPTS